MSENIHIYHQSMNVSQEIKSQASLLSKYALMAENAEESFTEWAELDAFNPLAMAKRFEKLEIKSKKKEETEKTEKKEDRILQVERIERAANDYQRRNNEFQARTLLLLRAHIKEDDTKEIILRKVLEIFSDHALADEALDFLLETSEGELAQNIRAAKEELNALYGREIRAGRNMGVQAREFTSQGLGTPTGLRDLYKDITGNPRDANQMFEELTAKYTYEKMKPMIDFLLHSLGSDLKSKGPSISRGELHRLLTETRSLQSILGVYAFFKSRMKLLLAAFKRRGIILPKKITYEILSRVFMKYLAERYPSSDKLLLLVPLIGVEEPEGQILIFLQMRDAVRGVAPKLFRNEQHRQDVLKSVIESMAELEEKYEEEEEE